MSVQHPDREEVMAWIDNEVPGVRSVEVRDHVAACDECRALANDLRRVSRDLARWQVEPGPLRWTNQPETSIPRRRRIAPWIWVFGGLAGASVVVIAIQSARRESIPLPRVATSSAQTATETLLQGQGLSPVGGAPVGRSGLGGRGTGGGNPNAGSPAGPPPAELAQPLIARTARLNLLVSDVDRTRAAIEREVTARRGSIARLELTGDRTSGRTLSVTVEVPEAGLTDALTALRGFGRVQNESQSAEDVTLQSVDLDARLLNARRTEDRFAAVLAGRTGRIGDVLEVERELARVRGQIEQMEAERTHLSARVAMASIDLAITEEHRAAATPVTPSIGRDLMNAFRDGVRNSLELAVDAAKLVLVTAPTAALVSMVLAGPLLFWRRRRAHLR